MRVIPVIMLGLTATSLMAVPYARAQQGGTVGTMAQEPGRQPAAASDGSLRSVSRTAETGVGKVGQRQEGPETARILTKPGRLSSRINNRIQSRIPNRIDDTYDSSADPTEQIQQADDRQRVRRPR